MCIDSMQRIKDALLSEHEQHFNYYLLKSWIAIWSKWNRDSSKPDLIQDYVTKAHAIFYYIYQEEKEKNNLSYIKSVYNNAKSLVFNQSLINMMMFNMFKVTIEHHVLYTNLNM
jgi:hypothetical protein